MIAPKTASRAAALFLLLAGFGPSAALAAEGVSPEQQARFDAFITSFRDEALAQGVTGETYDLAMSGLIPNPRVIELNNSQPEFVRPMWEYIDGAVSERRLELGRQQIAANAALFDRLEGNYPVPREVLAAIWGMESNFGENKGGHNLFQALSTLAYDGRRQDFGRSQLIAALKISQEEGIAPSEMVGSWAGAFGHTQFIPTTFLAHAVDGDGDGKRDLWNSAADALASAASYLEQSGWEGDRDWGFEVKLPEGFNYAIANANDERPMGAWSQMGITRFNGDPLPQGDMEAEVLLPVGANGPAFLITENFGAIMAYNSATSYALAISVLSDRLRGRDGIQGMWPYGEEQLSLTQRIALQEGLDAIGYPTGGADGIIGPLTREAIRAFQQSQGMTPDGFPSATLLTRVLNQRQTQR
jgi:membrane-bound lytic murein transglycosylase B